jgi:hypothetical protein
LHLFGGGAVLESVYCGAKELEALRHFLNFEGGALGRVVVSTRPRSPPIVLIIIIVVIILLLVIIINAISGCILLTLRFWRKPVLTFSDSCSFEIVLARISVHFRDKHTGRFVLVNGEDVNFVRVVVAGTRQLILVMGHGELRLILA